MILSPSLDSCDNAFMELGVYGLLLVLSFVLVTVAADIARAYRQDKDTHKGWPKWLAVGALIVLAIGLALVSAKGLLEGGQNSTVNCVLRNII